MQLLIASTIDAFMEYLMEIIQKNGSVSENQTTSVIAFMDALRKERTYLRQGLNMTPFNFKFNWQGNQDEFIKKSNNMRLHRAIGKELDKAGFSGAEFAEL